MWISVVLKFELLKKINIQTNLLEIEFMIEMNKLQPDLTFILGLIAVTRSCV